MKIYKYFYCVMGLLLLGNTAYLGHTETFEILMDGGNSYQLFLVVLAMAIMTFPLGAPGLMVGYSLAFTGVATLYQALFLAIIISFGIGFWQWFVLFPKIRPNSTNR